MTPPTADAPVCPQNDRVKALKAMEMTWNNMEKKEKLMWIKKAAEDQKRYEVGRGLPVRAARGRAELGAPSATESSDAPSWVGSLTPLPGAWSQKSQLGLCDPEWVS